MDVAARVLSVLVIDIAAFESVFVIDFVSSDFVESRRVDESMRDDLDCGLVPGVLDVKWTCIRRVSSQSEGDKHGKENRRELHVDDCMRLIFSDF